MAYPPAGRQLPSRRRRPLLSTLAAGVLAVGCADIIGADFQDYQLARPDASAGGKKPVESSGGRSAGSGGASNSGGSSEVSSGGTLVTIDAGHERDADAATNGDGSPTTVTDSGAGGSMDSGSAGDAETDAADSGGGMSSGGTTGSGGATGTGGKFVCVPKNCGDCGPLQLKCCTLDGRCGCATAGAICGI